MKRYATIRIERDSTAAMHQASEGFLAAWKTGEYQGEHFSFESPAALFRVLTPKRWELIERLQAKGPLGVRALARELERDVKRVHEDVTVLLDYGFLEKTDDGQLCVPFEEIRADFCLTRAV
jgi:predicted transcriptional regulator